MNKVVRKMIIELPDDLYDEIEREREERDSRRSFKATPPLLSA